MTGKRLKIISDNLSKEVFEKHGILILTLGQLEWFLQECLIFLILRTNFDTTNQTHNVLADYISRLTFDKKIGLVENFELLSKTLGEKIETIRKRRNVFIHGIILQRKDEVPTIEIIKKKGGVVKEEFTLENISSFLDFVETSGGELVTEFEAKGFRLSQ